MTEQPGEIGRPDLWQESRGLYLVPLRRHSPACAGHLKALIDEVAPALVLVEGPCDFDPLIPLVTAEATRPPVAIAFPERKRWRLVLGRYGEEGLGGGLRGADRRMDRALDYLYGREPARRLRSTRRTGFGSLDPSRLTPLRWLGECRSLFPQSVYETIQSHALDRYEMHGLLNDP